MDFLDDFIFILPPLSVFDHFEAQSQFFRPWVVALVTEIQQITKDEEALGPCSDLYEYHSGFSVRACSHRLI